MENEEIIDEPVVKKVFDPFNLHGGEKKEAPKAPPVEEINYADKYNRFKDFDVEEFDQLKELIDSTEGEAPQQKLTNLVTKHRQAAEQITELTKKEQERETWFKENQIVNSADFQATYEQPIQRSLDLYNTVIAEVAPDGTVKNDEMFGKLRKAIYNEGKELTTAQTKALLNKFSEQYKSKFGQAPELPTIKEVLDARDDLLYTMDQRAGAIAKWDQEKELKVAKQKTEQGQQVEIKRQASLLEKKEKYETLVKELDYNYYSGFFDADKVKAKAKEVNDLVTDVIMGKAPDLDYTKYMEDSVKARLFDDLLSQASKLKSFVDESTKGLPSSRSEAPRGETLKKEEPGSLAKRFGLL